MYLFRRFSFTDHDVENGDKFPHGGDECDHFWLSVCHESFIEISDLWVVFLGDDGGHVECVSPTQSTKSSPTKATTAMPNWRNATNLVSAHTFRNRPLNTTAAGRINRLNSNEPFTIIVSGSSDRKESRCRSSAVACWRTRQIVRAESSVNAPIQNECLRLNHVRSHSQRKFGLPFRTFDSGRFPHIGTGSIKRGTMICTTESVSKAKIGNMCVDLRRGDA